MEFAYNFDGSKKGILQLIKERRDLIKDNSDIDLDKLNDIYETVANFRFLREDEVTVLAEYIKETGTDDEFVFDLLRYRLEKTKMNEKEKEHFIKIVYKQAKNTRKLR